MFCEYGLAGISLAAPTANGDADGVAETEVGDGAVGGMAAGIAGAAAEATAAAGPDMPLPHRGESKGKKLRAHRMFKSFLLNAYRGQVGRGHGRIAV